MKRVCHGIASKMKLQFGNFKGEVVKDSDSQANSDTAMFTLRNYIATNKLSRVRLYLMSKQINEEDLEFQDSSSDEDLERITMFSAETQNTQSPDINNISDTLYTYVAENTDQPQQMSTDSEEQTLQVDKQSLEQPKNECIATMNHAINIQAARASRILPEPDFTTTDAVIVAVRHIDLGVITRHFQCSETITAVYDWVGSLHAEPVNFVLCNALSPDHPLDPSNSVCTVAKTMLIMNPEKSCPYLIHSEPEISMAGFSHISDFDNDIQEITPLPPAQKFNDDLR